jgi:hypothetical protein
LLDHSRDILDGRTRICAPKLVFFVYAGKGTGDLRRKSETVAERGESIQTPGQRGARPARSRSYRRVGPTAVIALAALVGLAAWLVIDSRKDSSPKSSGNTGPVALSRSGLKRFAGTISQPIYWVGPRRGKMYEITRSSRGTYLRYLPTGVKAGDSRPLLTIGTYPYQNAYAVAKTGSKAPDTVAQDIGGGGIATYNTKHPTNVYVAYPGSAYQVEVYDSKPAVAQRLATRGQVQPVLKTAESQARGPVAVSPAELRSLATSLGHPIYWAGSRPNTTYELWQTPRGYTYIRYLPSGVGVGDKGSYLIVGTYPMQNAFNITRDSSAKGKRTITRRIPDGGIAAYTKKYATNVYVAFPGVNVQIEVYDPSARLTPKLVASGQIVPVR